MTAQTGQKYPFPLLYRAHHQNYVDDLPFWLDLAREHPGPILELGCGTGRVLITLAEAGHRVCGIDNDPGMLAVLKKNLPASVESYAELIQADISEFHLAQQFSLILLPCNTYSTPDESMRKKILNCVHHHLQQDGHFAVSIPNPATLASLESGDNAEVESFFPHPLTGHPVQVSCEWERSAAQVTIHWHYDHLLPDGRVERLSTSVRHSLTSTQEYLQELDRAGFSIQAVYGDFDCSPHTSKSADLVILAAANPTHPYFTPPKPWTG